MFHLHEISLLSKTYHIIFAIQQDGDFFQSQYQCIFSR